MKSTTHKTQNNLDWKDVRPETSNNKTILCSNLYGNKRYILSNGIRRKSLIHNTKNQPALKRSVRLQLTKLHSRTTQETSAQLLSALEATQPAYNNKPINPLVDYRNRRSPRSPVYKIRWKPILAPKHDSTANSITPRFTSQTNWKMENKDHPLSR